MKRRVRARAARHLAYAGALSVGRVHGLRCAIRSLATCSPRDLWGEGLRPRLEVACEDASEENAWGCGRHAVGQHRAVLQEPNVRLRGEQPCGGQR